MKLYLLKKLFLAYMAFVLLSSPAVARRVLPEMQSRPATHRAGEMTTSSPRTEYERFTVPRYVLSNGLDITLYTSDLLASRLTWKDGESIIPLDDGRYLSVITDIGDPAISNEGDGSFHPFPEDRVLEILEGITHPNLDIEVEVYLLPYPRRNVLVSSAAGNTVFFSPHVRDIDPAVCAYIVAHELGHVFKNEYMPDGSRRWELYRGLRGITDDWKYSETGPHAYRPGEIFAEDFRVLFGGVDAAFGGRIENPELPSPLDVAGLEEFIAGVAGTLAAAESGLKASCYPNPFNPGTEVRIVVPLKILGAGERATVRIYDIRGRLVRKLYSGVPEVENLSVRWDGRDRNGNVVASAHYYALIEAGTARTSLKLVLLK